MRVLSISHTSRDDFWLLFDISLNQRTKQTGRDLWRPLIQCQSEADCEGRWGCWRLCLVEVWPWRVGHLSGFCSSDLVLPCLPISWEAMAKTLQKVKAVNTISSHLASRLLCCMLPLNWWGTLYLCMSVLFPLPLCGLGFQEDSFHPSLSTGFSFHLGAGQGEYSHSSCIANLFIPTDILQSKLLLSQLMLANLLQITLASSWLGCSKAFIVLANTAFTIA